MGKLWSSPVDTGKTNDPDPRTGLTSRDKYLIKTSWETVMTDATGNGVKLFMRLFEIKPEYQKALPFKNIPYKDLPQNKIFHAHCNTVIHSVASIISVINEPPVLESVIARIAQNHAKRLTDGSEFKDVKQALMDILSFLNEEQLGSWEKLTDWVFLEMEREVREVKADKT